MGFRNRRAGQFGFTRGIPGVKSHMGTLRPQIQKTLLEDWQLTQCLFGEHLLPINPQARIESEKTATPSQPSH